MGAHRHHWIAPNLLPWTGAKLAARGGDNCTSPRGASMILSFSRSTSGPHRDGQDSLLLLVSGQRRIYYTDKVPDGLKIDQERGGAPEYLPVEHDPILNPAGSGVQWKVRTLNAGDACLIPCGWWHCVDSEAQSVAVAVEVVSGEGGHRPMQHSCSGTHFCTST